MRRYLILTIWFLFLPLPAQAVQNAVRFDRLSMEDGLPHPVVYDILQDRQGFMWFATEDGAAKYDGYSFATFRSVPGDPGSVSPGAAYTIYEDRAGNIWIGIRNGGLNKYDSATGTITRYMHDPSNPESLSHDTVHYDSIFEDSSGMLWVGTANGLNRFDPVRNTFKRYFYDADNPDSVAKGVILTIQPDPVDEKLLWIGTGGGGLTRFDRINERFVRYEHDSRNPDTPSHNTVWRIHGEVSPEGTSVLWLCTAGGLDRFDTASGRFAHFRHDPGNPDSLSHNDVYSIVAAYDGTFWVGTHGGGLNRFDPVRQTFVSYKNSKHPHSIGGNVVHPLYRDRSGTLWVGTWGGGVSRIDPLNQKTRLYDENSGLSHSAVLSLCEDRTGAIWIGTWNGGLNRFDPSTGTFEHFRHDPTDPGTLSNDVVGAVFEDSRGELWVGTWGGGLNRFDRQTRRFARYVHQPDNPDSLSNNAVRDIAEDDRGHLWIATTSGGASRFDRESQTFQRFRHDPDNPDTISTDNVWAVLKDSSGDLWFTTSSGLDRFDTQAQRFVQYHHDKNDPFSLSSDGAINVFEDRQGRLWTTTTFGLNRLDRRTGRFTRYFTEQGLPDNRVTSIVQDSDGNLWLGTGKGLCRFNPETKEMTTFGPADGMQGNLFHYPAALKSRTGELWFGGPNGLNVIDPNALTRNPNAPPVVLTDFLIDGKSVRPAANSVLKRHIGYAREILVPPGVSKLGFEFSALNYTVSSKNQYAHKMEGFDEDWIYTGSDKRFARYTNLNPGEYVFRVKGSNNDGVWNDEGTSVKIVIMPAWWSTWWFRIAAGAFLLLAFFLAHRWRTVAMQRQNALLEKKFSEKERLLSGIIDFLPDATFVIDSQGKVLAWNRAIETMTGVKKEDMLGKGNYEYALPFYKKRRPMLLDFALAPSPGLETTYGQIRRDRDKMAAENYYPGFRGENAWLSVNASVLRGPRGEIIGAIESIRDVTDRKTAEEKLVASNRELEQFAYAASHDLQEPLRSVVSFLQLLQSRYGDHLDEKGRFYIERSVKAGKRMQALISDLLSLSRVSTRGRSFHATDLNLVVRNTVENLRSMVLEKKAVVHFDPLPECSVDANQIQSLFQNLILNALKYNQSGSPCVEIGCRDDEDRYRFFVKDNGIGIAPKFHERIFLVFQRLHTEREYPGTGMGLAICKKIVERHGGTMWVESEPGKGATFYFTIAKNISLQDNTLNPAQ